MSSKAGRIGAIAAGLAACSLALSPALSAVRSVLATAQSGLDPKVSLKILGSIGSFTPVTSDERLAEAYVRAARDSQSRGFKFTPTSGTMSGERSMTVLVRASADSPAGLSAKRALPNLGIAPVAYNLGMTKGLSRFASETSASAREPSPIIEQPVEMPGNGYVLPSKPSRFSADLQVEAREQTAVAPTNNAPATLGSEKTYSAA